MSICRVFKYVLIFILYWSRIGLQDCVSFRYTAKWFSCTHTCICCCCLVTELCLFCYPVDCSLQASSVRGISQAGLLEKVAIFFSRGFSRTRDWNCISWNSRIILYCLDTREAHTCICSFFQILIPIVSVVQSLSPVQLFGPSGLLHARLPCLSLSPRVCSNSCPLSWWSHPTISSSVAPFSSCPI